jgi:hypothetical protein
VDFPNAKIIPDEIYDYEGELIGGSLLAACPLQKVCWFPHDTQSIPASSLFTGDRRLDHDIPSSDCNVYGRKLHINIRPSH